MSAETPQAKQRFVLALGHCRDARLVQRTLDLCLTDTIQTQDVARVLAKLLENPASRERSWKFLTRQWKQVSARLPSALVRRMIEATQHRSGARAKQELKSFFRRHPVPTAVRTIKQVEERIDVRTAQLRRNKPELRRWLRTRQRA